MAMAQFTTFSHVHDSRPQVHDWSDFETLFFELRVTPDKAGVPLYCPAVFAGGRRLRANVVSVNFIVLDIDSASEEYVMEAISVLTETCNLRVYFATSHSHSRGLEAGTYKCRLVLEVSRPILPEEWDRVWYSVYELSGSIADTACKDPGHIYYFPSCPPGDENDARIELFNPNGVVLDVDVVLDTAGAPPSSWIPTINPDAIKHIEASERYQLAKTFIDANMGPAPEGRRNSTAFRVSLLCGDFGLEAEESWPLLTSWNETCEPPLDDKELTAVHASAYGHKRKTPFGWRLIDHGKHDNLDEKHIQRFAKSVSWKPGSLGMTGRWLLKILNGDAIGTEAPQIFMSVSELLGRNYPAADSLGLAVLMQESIQATHTQGFQDITVTAVGEMIRTAQLEHQLAKSRESMAEQHRLKHRIQSAYLSVGIRDRSSPYTKEEWDRWVTESGVENKDELVQQLIVRYGKSYYFFVAGEYTHRPYQEGEATDMVKVALLPTEVPFMKLTQTGYTPMKMNELFERYGTVANSVVVDMTAQKSHFDRQAQILVEAPCPFRIQPDEAKYDERVDRWLRLLGGDLQEKLLDWVACVPVVKDPIAALFLYGEARTGKSLLANGIGRLWIDPARGGPVSLVSVAGDFNDDIRKSPLVFADEVVPTDYRGDPKTDWMCELTQAKSHVYKRKHIPNSTIVGCLRLIIASNTPDIIVNDHKTLTNQAIEALTERFLCVHVNSKAAREYLDELKEGDNADLFKGDAIPKHVWWLHRNRTVKYGSRFLVAGVSNSELEMRMMTGAGLRSEVCHFLSRFILSAMSDSGGAAGSRPFVRSGRKGVQRLLVSAKILHTHWSTVLPNAKDTPSTGAIEKALGGVCEERLRTAEGYFRPVNLGRIKHWAATNGLCSSAEFDAALQKLGLPVPQVQIASENSDVTTEE
jgi:hypothetical protein